MSFCMHIFIIFLNRAMVKGGVMPPMFVDNLGYSSLSTQRGPRKMMSISSMAGRPWFSL